MTLADFQSAFQNRILAGMDGARSQKESMGIGVYVDAYRLRLASAVASDYPALRNSMEESEFEALVLAYIESTRSTTPNLRWYSRGLPEFMMEDARWRHLTGETSLACLERALDDAFDSADAAIGSANELSALGPQDMFRLRFEFQPSLRLLTLESGTCGRYEALSGGEELARCEEGRESVLIWRRSGDCFYRLLEEDESFALTLAREGKSFGDLCELFAFRENGEDVDRRSAIFLSRWLADELVSAITLTD
ncbi:DNA-binding domain-containing protein [Methylosinus sp. Ce-a6]|uniref:HvfC/BufC N-terminal domain-containing protein n=1 Tax=Methylosinus sp. Ce-a6 TaxID=2172005 RepID=UPI00135CC233|nr:DNA-binding domain-containing protein [Methylosinus sp. Ce-a6]